MPGVIKLPHQSQNQNQPPNQPLRKPALGRGLGALLADARAPSGGSLVRLPLDQVHGDRSNPRRAFDETALDELAVSLKHHGVLQPILVRRDARGGYRLIAGERRWRAAQRAGLEDIPAVIREASDADAYELALVENIQRADLSPLEEAEAYRRLLEERRLTQEQIADRVGKNRSTVANALRLLALPAEVKQLLNDRELNMGHARTLLGLAKPQEMVALARRVVAEGLSVRAAEALVKEGRPTPSTKRRAASRASPDARRLVEDLQRRLGTKVRLRERSQGKGTLEIDYFTFEDLDRIVGLIRR